MIIEVSTLSSQIKTENIKLLNTLIELYTFQVPGAFYAKSYGKFWDGKKRFISNKGVFQTGLLNSILKDLKRVNIDPKIVYLDSDKSIEVPLEISLPNWEFRPYQKNILNLALEAKRGIIKAPTGSGKTSLIAYLLHLFKDKPALVLFNKKQLLVQCYEFLTKTIGLTDIGLAFGEGFIPAKQMLCTVQSIEKVLGLPAEKPDILLVDEVHEFCSGKFTSKVINVFPSAKYRFGFTATIPSDKIKFTTLIGAFGDTVSSVGTQDLITSGYLAKPHIKMITINHNVSSYSRLGYQDLYLSGIACNPIRNEVISKIVSSIKHPNPKVAVIAQSLEHAKILNQLIPNSKKIEGLTSLAERNDAISWFKKANRPTLIGTNILQTGIDIKEITHLIIARGLKSDIPTIQALGRALRIDKDHEVYIYDFMDEDDGILKKHSRSRLKAYKKEEHKVQII